MAGNESQILRKIREGEGKLSDLEGVRRQLEYEVGRKYVESHLNDKNFEIYYEEELKKILELMDEKERIEKQVLALRGKRKCDACKAIIELNSSFCNKCGSKLENIDISRLIGGNICPNCGAIVDVDVNFCTSCGTKMR